MKMATCRIYSCGDCNWSEPSWGVDEPVLYSRCTKANGRRIEDTFLLPSWCPLPDAPQKVVESAPTVPAVAATNTASNAIALLEECIANGDRGQDSLIAWYSGQRELINETIIDAQQHTFCGTL